MVSRVTREDDNADEAAREIEISFTLHLAGSWGSMGSEHTNIEDWRGRRVRI